jgi:hypothetical protein
MTPANDAAVGEPFDVLNPSAIRAGDGMWQITGSASASRHSAPVGTIGISPILECLVIHHSLTYYSARPSK